MKNPYSSINITTCRPKAQPSVEMFRIQKDVVNPVVHTIADDEMVLAPPPVPKVATVMATAPFVPDKPTVPPDVVQRPAPTKPQRQTRPIDPLVLGIENTDGMYEIAHPNAKQEIEMKEARRMESLISKLYASENGRSRGWTKTHLEEFMKPRTISGSKHAPKGSTAFDWSAVFTDKKLSAALDFVALAKGIRIAVWNPDEKVVGIWPAADASEAGITVPVVYHVSVTGIPMTDKTSVFETGWTLRAPLAVEHSLEKLSLDELTNVATGLGIKELTGKKQDRVRQIATIRVMKRFEIPPKS